MNLSLDFGPPICGDPKYLLYFCFCSSPPISRHLHEVSVVIFIIKLRKNARSPSVSVPDLRILIESTIYETYGAHLAYFC